MHVEAPSRCASSHVCSESEPEVLLDDEVGDAVVGQAGEPALEEGVQGRLAHVDRRVRPDRREPQVGRDLVGLAEGRVVEPAAAALVRARSSERAVDVDAPDGAAGERSAEGDRDRPPAAAEVEQVAGRARVGGAGEQHGGARVEAVGGVDAARRAQRRAGGPRGVTSMVRRSSGRGRLGGEVVVGRLAHQGHRIGRRRTPATTSTVTAG